MLHKGLLEFLRVLAILIVGANHSSLAYAQSKNKSCKEHPKLIGPCFNVRGRLSAYNGGPTLRLWPIGTARLLGVSQGRFYLPDYDNVPPEVVAKLASFETEMFADFTVCPFTKDEPGVMRLICVESAKNILVREREQK